jgi:hypothetical protein
MAWHHGIFPSRGALLGGLAYLAWSLIGAVSLTVLLEIAARLWHPEAARRAADEEADWLQFSPSLGWQSRPHFSGEVFGAHRSFDGEGFFTADSATGAGRAPILFLGDSRTFGNSVPTADSYPRILAGLLPESRVYNLAIPGYSVWQGYAALKLYAPRLRPEVVVFAFGYNDRRYVLRREDADGEAAFRRLERRARLRLWLDSLAVIGLLRGRSEWAHPEKIETVVARELDLETLVPRVSAADFGRHLRAAARYCAERRIRLVLIWFGDNPQQAGHLERGYLALQRQQLAEAEAELQAAVALGNSFSDAARLYLAQLYRVRGGAVDGQKVGRSPRIFHSLAGGYPLAAAGEYRQVLLTVAAAEKLAVVDAGAATDIHPEWFFDNCHFGREAHELTARLLHAELKRPMPENFRSGGKDRAGTPDRTAATSN